MKAGSTIALLSAANLILLGLVGYLSVRNHEYRPIEARLDHSSNSLETSAVEKAVEPVAGLVAKPFHWSQLESTNFQTYIANLRGVGCPEQTIRDMVAAELPSLNASKREQLRREENPPGLGLENERKEMAQLDASLLAAVLGRDGVATTVHPSEVTEAVSEDSPQTISARNARVAWPVVFVPKEIASTGLNANQSSVVERLRNQFVEEIGGTNQDPNDPAYLKRWQVAQSKIDQSVKTMLGVQTFLLYERQARTSIPGNPQR